MTQRKPITSGAKSKFGTGQGHEVPKSLALPSTKVVADLSAEGGEEEADE